MSIDEPWEKIFYDLKLDGHDFSKAPARITGTQIKNSTRHFQSTAQREVRILAKRDTRESRPSIFVENNLFLLPTTNREYVLIQGEGYVDIPIANADSIEYVSNLDFKLDTVSYGDSEMQHLDFAYASSLVRTFMNDPSLVLTIRGRKYTPAFNFRVGNHRINVQSVQTEVDAGYEGKEKVVLIEAKNSRATNTIIRQLFYPFRQWKTVTDKPIISLFFDKSADGYTFSEFIFDDMDDYNSIRCTKTKKFVIVGSNL